MIFSPFIVRQHAHLCSKQIAACSCLQMEHMHSRCFMLIVFSIFFCCFDFSSTYNHNKTKGIPITKNMLIVRAGTRKTNKNIPKQTVDIPSAESHRFVRLPIYKIT